MKNIRSIIALIITIGALGILFYITQKHIEDKDITIQVLGILNTLLIGGVIAYYFSSSHKMVSAETEQPNTTTTSVTTSETQTPSNE